MAPFPRWSRHVSTSQRGSQVVRAASVQPAPGSTDLRRLSRAPLAGVQDRNEPQRRTHGRLVSQLLALMRSNTARLPTERRTLSLVELVQERMAELAPLAAAHDVELDFTGSRDAATQGDREGMVSLLDNLIENAIKYSPAGGTIRVSGHAPAAGATGVTTLTVEDEGPGDRARTPPTCVRPLLPCARPATAR